MKDTEKEQLAEKIRAAITATTEDIAALTELTRPIAPDNAIGRLSRMEAMSSKSVNEAALTSARQRLTKLKYALANLNDEAFGICVECGDPIPVARILAVPETNRCVECAE